ncbi:MAG: D-glycero-beta-D-manno-heptose 1,7-bisphosphate 7-phosphatase [Proteobacteria bacterium]|nr:D-glycero-beta-D-manno-heptose 1,7-bisphosphate 7-phosphatase [Pseudomonadota bacterium]
MKVLVLDRDGVINADSPEYIKSPEEWHPLPGSVDAIARASRAGYTVAVASNQSGVGRGYFDIDTLSAIHDRMIETVEAAGGRIDLIVFCPHAPDEGCECRKPKAGLLRRIESELSVALAGSWMVGDSMKDIAAARVVDMQPVLVRTGNGADVERELEESSGVLVFDDLASAVDRLLEEQ